MQHYVREIKTVTTSRVACKGGDYGHPLIYLDVEKFGEIKCPYCSQHFVFKKASAAS
jgi:uncharacterized Zn-finger protein